MRGEAIALLLLLMKRVVSLDMTSEYTYQILGGGEYTEANRPCRWSNETPLRCKGYEPGNAPKNMKALPLEDFPLIKDFEIVLEAMIDETGYPPFGYHVMFFSPSLGYIASFPWWDNATRDLAKDEFWVLGEHNGSDWRYDHPEFHPDRPISIPLGSFDDPYTALEQGWEIVIAQHDMYVYVLEGGMDKRRLKGYHSWFKVSLDRYLEQWQAIKELLTITGLKSW